MNLYRFFTALIFATMAVYHTSSGMKEKTILKTCTPLNKMTKGKKTQKQFKQKREETKKLSRIQQLQDAKDSLTPLKIVPNKPEQTIKELLEFKLETSDDFSSDDETNENKELIKQFYKKMLYKRFKNEKEFHKLNKCLTEKSNELTKILQQNNHIKNDQTKVENSIKNITQQLNDLRISRMFYGYSITELLKDTEIDDTTKKLTAIDPDTQEVLDDTTSQNPAHLISLLEINDNVHKDAYDDLFYDCFTALQNLKGNDQLDEKTKSQKEEFEKWQISELFMLHPLFAILYLDELKQEKETTELAENLLKELKNRYSELDKFI